MSELSLITSRQRFHLLDTDSAAKIYYRLMNNCLELTVLFLGQGHVIRVLKDAESRHPSGV